ncbi:MFS transporter [Kribbella solani]|uniref:MFS transporter n=1 Tax=Kribbella solani TaxID=236067 RepID=UPI0029B014DA|nr:MFS transporter [Kribbella solani]MDX3004519.1 MFS transporter [Kribbella solani]
MQAAEGARPGSARSLRRALWGLCVTELISWGVLYYTVPATVPTLVAQTGWTATAIMTGFSCGLLASAAAAIPVGRLIDRYGPRWVMTGGSLLGTTSLALAALASSPLAFGLAWLPAGVAMAALLYPPAFTALTYWYGPRRSRALMTLTLVGGLASTVFAPLSGLLAAELGWRVTYVVLAAFLLATTGPIHLICLKLPCVAQTGRVRHDRHTRQVRTSRTFWLLTTALALAAFGLKASLTNLVPLLVERGLSAPTAAIFLGVAGAGQVLGRLVFPLLAGRTSPRRRDVIILAAGAVSLAVLALPPGLAGPLAAVALLTGGVCSRGRDRWVPRRVRVAGRRHRRRSSADPTHARPHHP